MGRHEEALAVYRAVLAEADEHTDAEPSNVQRMAVALVEGGIGLCLLAMGQWHAAAALFGRLRQVHLAVNSPGTAAAVGNDRREHVLELLSCLPEG